MSRRNTGTVHTGPGDRPTQPARLTRKLTLQDRHCSNRVERIKSTHPTYPARQNLAATSSLHNHSRCGLRSRLGVVHQHPSGSDSTRHSNQQPSEGWQVHSERANLWQVYSHQIVHRQAHRRPADALSCSLRRQEFFQRKAISRPINVFLGHFVAGKKNLILKPCIACSRQLVPVSKTFRV